MTDTGPADQQQPPLGSAEGLGALDHQHDLGAGQGRSFPETQGRTRGVLRREALPGGHSLPTCTRTWAAASTPSPQ